jgi:16S rRNA (guanine527-N7)-methyltransferase
MRAGAAADDSHAAEHLRTTATTSKRLLELDQKTRELLATYREELLHWNERFNLTAVTDPADVDHKLIGDALRLLPAVDRIAASKTKMGPLCVIDIGTGAGFPGLVLKIARPDLDMTLLEATGKKVTFLQHMIDLAGLNGVIAIHGRAEDLGQDRRFRAQFDVATARAVSSLPVLLELSIPLLRRGGTALFPKGADIDVELEEGKRAGAEIGADIVDVESLPIEDGESVTQLVIAAKIRETPTRFPRRSGLPAREPLGRAKR